MLLVSFHLQRHMGNFLIQVYGPCILLVVLSWVSFWLNREATADRVSLGKPDRFARQNVFITDNLFSGITTVLTMTFLGLEARTDLPKVGYPTALDFFVFLSFGFIFATIIQVNDFRATMIKVTKNEIICSSLSCTTIQNTDLERFISAQSSILNPIRPTAMPGIPTTNW
jgi:hypothetical protein